MFERCGGVRFGCGGGDSGRFSSVGGGRFGAGGWFEVGGGSRFGVNVLLILLLCALFQKLALRCDIF